MLPFNDFLFTVDEDISIWRTNWFKKQKQEQIKLSRQCRYKIRMSLAHTRDINGAIDKLPVPAKLKTVLNLEEDFTEFMTHTDDGGPYETCLLYDVNLN